VISVNGEAFDRQNLTIATLLSDMAVETRGVAVAVNGEIVRRGDWAVTKLLEGDRVEIVSAAAGGA
jgi:sulfur carrier protein